MKHYDFVVIGSGIAGLSFALKAAQHGSVAVVTKRKGADTNTAWAQGGIACVTSDEDSFEMHVRDTLEAALVCVTKMPSAPLSPKAPPESPSLWNSAFISMNEMFPAIESSIWERKEAIPSDAFFTFRM